MTMSTPVWEDGAWDGLPSVVADLDADVCVVGLGGSGLACIHELLDLGVRVVGIDAGPVAAGAAGRNGGFLLAGCYLFHHEAVARYGRERAVTIYRATIAQIRRMAEETPAAVRLTGSLRIAMSPEESEDCAAQLEAMRADDLPVDEYEGLEGSGLLIPTDGAFDPLLRARTLARSALRRGAQLFESSPATSLEPGVVTTPRGRIRCDVIVVAVDGALTRVVPSLGSRVRTARLQMLATAPTSEVRIDRPVYARYGMEYWQQLADGRVALGGYRDAGGDAEWTTSTEVTDVVQRELDRHLREVIGVTAPVTRRWAASVGYTTDGLPILEEVAPGTWAIGGYSGTGNVIGALCGRGVARLALEQDSSIAAPFLSDVPLNS